jgi:hypothetical protein
MRKTPLLLNRICPASGELARYEYPAALARAQDRILHEAELLEVTAYGGT